MIEVDNGRLVARRNIDRIVADARLVQHIAEKRFVQTATDRVIGRAARRARRIGHQVRRRAGIVFSDEALDFVGIRPIEIG
jgi:hypothetical protein